MKRKKLLISIIVVLVLFFIFLDTLVTFDINIKWFSQLGFLSIYFTQIKAIAILTLPIFIVLFAAIWFYYISIRKSIIKHKNIIETDLRKRALEKKIVFLADLVVSFFTALGFSSSYWYMILQFANATPFNEVDPIFKKDISFYIFKLPLIQSLYGRALGLLFFLVLLTLVLYFALNLKDGFNFGSNGKIINNIKFSKGGIKGFAGKQLAIIGALILLCLSFGFIVKAWNLVYSPTGVVFGAGYTDVKVSLMFYRILTVVCLLGAVVVFTSVMYSKVKPILWVIGIIVVLVIGEGAASAAVQRFIVKSNEKNFEQPYIEYNIQATKKAFNVNDVKQIPYDLSHQLTKEDIQKNNDSIDNIKINSFEPSMEFYNQVQVIRPYYTFTDTDVDRYYINGKYSQIFISPREITLESMDNNTWQNRHFTYTHGYGVVMSKVATVTAEGQPDFVMKDIPVNNSTDIKLDNPRIYFGEKTDDFAIVNAKNLTEFDYPEGGANKDTTYSANSGINLTSWNRLLFALYQKDINFLLSRNIDDNSKILINRNVMKRVEKIAPFLSYDKDAQLVINDGKLYWIIDGYTVSSRYPYSTPYNNINYIRNSVKVVIDAVDGSTSFYIVDSKDPIVESYAKIFPKLFKKLEEVPKGIEQHHRYPEYIYDVQCEVLSKYHVTDPMVFYNGDDQWNISKNQKQLDSEKITNPSSYLIMKLAGETKEEMVLVNYYTMREKENMVALFGARMDGDNYGKLFMYKYPTSKPIYSPYLFKQKLKQDTAISKELSLWNKEGSQVQFGDTTILPLDNSLLYVEPVYLRASGKNSIPEMKRVIVGYNDKMVMSENIDTALALIFDIKAPAEGGITPTPGTTTGPVITPELKEAKDLYNKALEAQKNGDWAKYGEYIKKLGEILNKIN